MDRNEDIWMPKAKRSPMLSRKGRIGGGLLAGAAGLSAIGLALTTGGAQLPSLLTAAKGAQPARLTSTLDSSSKPAGGTTAGSSDSDQSDLRPTSSAAGSTSSGVKSSSPTAGSAQAEPKDPAGSEGSHTDLSGTVGTVGSESFPLTEGGGTTVTVDNGAATRYTQTAPAVVSEATAGTWIVAKGTRASDGSLAATALSIVPAPPSSAGSDWSSASASNSSSKDSSPYVSGKVTDNNGGILTVTTRGGSQTVTTATTPSTAVTKTTIVGFSDLKSGDTVQVDGVVNSDGTVAAHSVNIGVTPAVAGHQGDDAYGSGRGEDPQASTGGSNTSSSAKGSSTSSSNSSSASDHQGSQGAGSGASRGEQSGSNYGGRQDGSGSGGGSGQG